MTLVEILPLGAQHASPTAESAPRLGLWAVIMVLHCRLSHPVADHALLILQLLSPDSLHLEALLPRTMDVALSRRTAEDSTPWSASVRFPNISASDT
ncbi:hypothetical protein VTN00DRAFT_200 [Thermoascus crustaceus]|uniref:uncharacterized protein n=1 Tax=Thermoascus crustaceus TaxID=5088 RepID=UPI003742ACA3